MICKVACALLVISATAQAGPVYRAIELPIPAGSGESAVEARAVDNGAAGGWDIRFGRGLFWPNAQAQPVDLTPPVASFGFVDSIFGQQQAGSVEIAGKFHAFLWTGSAVGGVDLHPTGYDSSSIGDTDAHHQAGSASVNGLGHAMIWSGTAMSARDVHPAGYTSTAIAGIDGEQYVGNGTAPTFATDYHPLLWMRDGSVVDLLPDGYIRASARAISGDMIVGDGQLASDPAGDFHGLLWRGSSNQAIDMTPNGFLDAILWDISGNRIVGVANDPQHRSHALLWTGATANEFVDLNQFLPAGFDDAQAFGVDARGDIVGSARNLESLSEFRPIMWVPVSSAIPLPAAIWPGMIVLTIAFRLHRSLARTVVSPV